MINKTNNYPVITPKHHCNSLRHQYENINNSNHKEEGIRTGKMLIFVEGVLKPGSLYSSNIYLFIHLLL